MIAHIFATNRFRFRKQLRIPVEYHLVKQNQNGTTIDYQLKGDNMKEIEQWLAQVKKIWESRFNQLDSALATLKKKNK